MPVTKRPVDKVGRDVEPSRAITHKYLARSVADAAIYTGPDERRAVIENAVMEALAASVCDERGRAAENALALKRAGSRGPGRTCDCSTFRIALRNLAKCPITAGSQAHYRDWHLTRGVPDPLRAARILTGLRVEKITTPARPWSRCVAGVAHHRICCRRFGHDGRHIDRDGHGWEDRKIEKPSNAALRKGAGKRGGR